MKNSELFIVCATSISSANYRKEEHNSYFKNKTKYFKNKTNAETFIQKDIQSAIKHAETVGHIVTKVTPLIYKIKTDDRSYYIEWNLIETVLED